MNKLDEDYDEINEILNNNLHNNFMNHGYYPSFKNIKAEYLNFKHQASLYIKLVQNINSNNKTLLDIGCGRGGGVDTYKNNYNFSKIVGLDLNSSNINHCRKMIKEVEFIKGNAEDLPFKSNSFDFITNVESAYSYSNLFQFFNEVKRVLKPKGIFIYTDTFSNNNLLNVYNSTLVENLLPFKKVIKEDITKNVIKSCNKDFFRWFKTLEGNKARKFHLDIALKKYIEYKTKQSKYIIYTCYNE